MKDARRVKEPGLYQVDLDSSSRLKSVTQEKDLDEFLNTAQLAGTEFTAERRNIKVIQQSTGSSHNPHILTDEEEEKVLRKHEENKKRLRVPRRPLWNKSMTSIDLDRREKDAFLDWRRGLAELQEQENFLLTPFERNIEVWRQLWRVLERSHLVVQIVDARNPLKFRCEDLEEYIQDVEGPEGEAGIGAGKRKSMLLINKADLLNSQQRSHWADFFDKRGVQCAFYSAANAVAIQQARRDFEEHHNNKQSRAMQEHEDPTDSNNEMDEADADGNEDSSDRSSDEEGYFSAEEAPTNSQDSRVKILSVVELEDLFVKLAPDLSEFTDASGQPPSKIVIGLVGYPNVGKSSTINSLLGEKKVSVSSTPGKTKHFQTIHLSDNIILCDCPGLVFPQFATTKADLVCDGVLPIDQMREYTGPISLVVKRLPREILEATYGLNIKTHRIEDGGDDTISAGNFLIAYAIARGYMRSGQGNPDEARAARYILKDYVNGKLLFCHPPPNISEKLFNEQSHRHAMLRVVGKKTAPATRVGKDSDTFIPSNVQPPNDSTPIAFFSRGTKSQAVDVDFFEEDTLSARPFIQGSQANGKQFSRPTFYPHQTATADDGTPLEIRQSRLRSLSQHADSGKKHHRKMKRVKQRSGKGYD